MNRDIELAVRKELAERIGFDRFDLWLADCRFELDGSRLIVVCEDSFQLEVIHKNLHRELLIATKSLQGVDYTLEYRAAPPVSVHLSKSTNKKKQNRAIASATLTVEDSTSSQQLAAISEASVGPAKLGSASSSISDANSESKTTEGSNLRVVSLVSSGSSAGDSGPSFSQVIVGECNRLAHVSAQHVTTRLGAVTPLVFCGPTGTGKSLLMQCIHRAVRAQGARLKTLYLSSEQFTTSFTEALHGRGMPNFRAKHRDIDLLLIDDIHFFADKRSTLVEFHHTIEHLLKSRKQIVLSTTRSLQELHEFGSELVARLSGGLVCQIGLEDGEVRQRILEQFCSRQGVMISSEIAASIAAAAPSDARQLSGIANRLFAIQLHLGRELDADEVFSGIADLLAVGQKQPVLQDVEKAICSVLGVTEELLRSSKKLKSHAHPRMLAMWLSRKYTRSALSEIGEYFGGKKHTTVLSAEKQVKQWIEQNKEIQLPKLSCPIVEVIRRIESRLKRA